MPITGFATAEGTRRYRDRMIKAGVAPGHFRNGLGGLALSTIGLGTYLGGYDARTDSLYLEAVKESARIGCNIIDTAINYRCQRSERAIGQALADLVQRGEIRRDEILIATKGGYIPYDGTQPKDNKAYIQQTFVAPGIITASDVIADCHCLAPAFLRHQLDASLTNLGLTCVDVYYVHNPETQLDHVSREEFLKRMRAAFEVLEEAVAGGKVRFYGTATWNGYRALAGSHGHLSLEALAAIARDVGGKDHRFRAVQVPFNLGMPEALTQQTQTVNGKPMSLLEAAKMFDVFVMASAPILQGQLTQGLPDEIRTGLGDGTDAQRAIQFVRSTPGIGTALIGMKQQVHVHDNLAVAKSPPLVADEFLKLFK
jgi:aryl-alcohol dehydrogenase-like predicted oxidoreductase